MGSVNDKYYVKYNQDLDTYYIGKDEKVIVVESSDKGRAEKVMKKKVNN